MTTKQLFQIMKISVININSRRFEQIFETYYKNKRSFVFSKFLIKAFYTCRIKQERKQDKTEDKKSNNTKEKTKKKRQTLNSQFKDKSNNSNHRHK